ncbi:helix-turn-helix domain-containing protein [Nonomuraea sp. NPDC049695]|uniref:helix-turn-helix domain-containing protein n=1 Tax=Nonomuraea sp. NPDC049695 TaxID=3154734 RepID=UPI00342C48CE
MDKLLNVEEAAELLNTSPRFVRRLIAERRIEFVKLGRPVRIRESALIAYVVAGTVAPMHATDAVPASGRAA